MSNAQIIGILILAIPLMLWMLPERGLSSLALIISRVILMYAISIILITAIVVVFVL